VDAAAVSVGDGVATVAIAMVKDVVAAVVGVAGVGVVAKAATKRRGCR